MTSKPDIILASESPYKRKLIQRLHLAISFKTADIDETPLENELPLDCVKRLSKQKAQKIAESNADHWIIASDQIAIETEVNDAADTDNKSLDTEPSTNLKQNIIGKPHNLTNAISQLQNFSGKTIKFVTGVTLLNKSQNFTAYKQSQVEVTFKQLSREAIEYYLSVDQPFDCAGSFKVESLGIALFESVKSDDPTSLEGLPLITVCDLFQQAGINCLSK